jgi:hypothetical protein
MCVWGSRELQRGIAKLMVPTTTTTYQKLWRRGGEGKGENVNDPSQG